MNKMEMEMKMTNEMHNKRSLSDVQFFNKYMNGVRTHTFIFIYEKPNKSFSWLIFIQACHTFRFFSSGTQIYEFFSIR